MSTARKPKQPAIRKAPTPRRSLRASAVVGILDRVDDRVCVAAFAGFPHAVDEELERGFVSHDAPDRPRLNRPQHVATATDKGEGKP